MKKVTIKKMTLHYFKGIKSQEVAFKENETIIAGPNGCGKSTIADAFTWLLWGKNQNGDTNFLIKTVDENGEEIPHVDHEVSAVINVDGVDISIRRCLVPEYNKNDELKGNHTEYFWNDVPLKKGEFDAKVKAIIDENIFKLITSPFAFLNLDWKKQRETLMAMAGDIKDEDVAGDNVDFIGMLKFINEHNISIEEHRRSINMRISRINDQMAEIPARIDESRRNVPSMPDIKALEDERVDVENKIAEIDKANADVVAAQSKAMQMRLDSLKVVNDLKAKMCAMLNDAQAEERRKIHLFNVEYDKHQAYADECEARKSNVLLAQKKEVDTINANIEAGRLNMDAISKQIDALRSKWIEVNARTFVAEEYLVCPVFNKPCKDCDACEKYELNQGAAFEAFSKQKTEELANITAEGKGLAMRLNEVKADMDVLNGKLESAKVCVNDVVAAIDEEISKARKYMSENPRKPLISTIKWDDIPGHEEMDKELEEAETIADSFEVVYENNSQENEEKKELQKRLYDIATQMAIVGQIGLIENRVKELEAQLRELGVAKMELEADKHIVDDFEIAKMNEVSRKVNGMFKVVTWQMFQRQVNGENIPACVALVNGVRWSDANTAARINAGIDVAYTLSQANEVSAPMFIDNSECSGYIYYPGNQQRILLMFDKKETFFVVK